MQLMGHPLRPVCLLLSLNPTLCLLLKDAVSIIGAVRPTSEPEIECTGGGNGADKGPFDSMDSVGGSKDMQVGAHSVVAA